LRLRQGLYSHCKSKETCAEKSTVTFSELPRIKKIFYESVNISYHNLTKYLSNNRNRVLAVITHDQPVSPRRIF
jgi:hypothetical protein